MTPIVVILQIFAAAFSVSVRQFANDFHNIYSNHWPYWCKIFKEFVDTYPDLNLSLTSYLLERAISEIQSCQLSCQLCQIAKTRFCESCTRMYSALNRVPIRYQWTVSSKCQFQAIKARHHRLKIHIPRCGPLKHKWKCIFMAHANQLFNKDTELYPGFSGGYRNEYQNLC